MDYTKNLKLSKPSYDDDVDIQIINTNMDMLDDNISNLDYVKNVTTYNNGLTFTKKDNSQIKVPLNYLKLTGGTVTGNTEFTGILTNNGKNISRLFNDSPDNWTPLIDWDKMCEVYGTVKVEYSYIKNGKTITIQRPNWTNVGAGDNLPVVAFGAKDIYLSEDFTSYDKLMILFVKSRNFADLSVTYIDTKELDWRMRNYRMCNLNHGEDTWNVYGYDTYGTDLTHQSTKRKLVFNQSSSMIVNVFGIKYAEIK